MGNRTRLAAWVLVAAASGAQAEGTIETPLRDPGVPPGLRKERAVEPPSTGPALAAQVERKLRESFDAAAAPHGGTLTREQARDAGLGFISRHFDAIDRRSTGRVGFDDYKRFLRERGAALE